MSPSVLQRTVVAPPCGSNAIVEVERYLPWLKLNAYFTPVVSDDSVIRMLPSPNFLPSHLLIAPGPSSGPSKLYTSVGSFSLVQGLHSFHFLRLLTQGKTASGLAWIAMERSTWYFEGKNSPTTTRSTTRINKTSRIFLRIFIGFQVTAAETEYTGGRLSASSRQVSPSSSD